MVNHPNRNRRPEAVTDSFLSFLNRIEHLEFEEAKRRLRRLSVFKALHTVRSCWT